MTIFLTSGKWFMCIFALWKEMKRILTIKMTLNEVLRTLRSLNEDNEITIFSIIG